MAQQTINVGAAPNDGTGDPDRTAWTKANANFTELYAGGGGNVTAPQGRLTLQTATPVMTTSQTAKTTVFYTPYCGNKVALYDGTTLVPTTFAELSNLTTASSVGNAGPAAVAANSVYDLFVWSNAGTVTLTRGPAWTSDTARSAGTTLVMVNGILLNNVSITNGPAASRGTYVGTTRSNASSQLNWQLPSAANGGGAGILGVWNCYNRVMSGGECRDTTSSWAGSNTTIMLKNRNANNSIAFVSGLQEDLAQAIHNLGLVTNFSDGTTAIGGIGVDTSTVFTSITAQATGGASITSTVPPVAYAATSFGYHVWNALEAANGGNSPTVFGNLTGPPARNVSSLGFSFPM